MDIPIRCEFPPMTEFAGMQPEQQHLQVAQFNYILVVGMGTEKESLTEKECLELQQTCLK